MKNGVVSRTFNTDCLLKMKEYPDGYFDLAVVDPPYGGGGISRQERNEVRRPVREIRLSRTGGGWAAKFGKKIIAWDNAPSKEYFDELFRVSKQQIIWGGNYFDLPPCRCFIAWHKTNIPEEFTWSTPGRASTKTPSYGTAPAQGARMNRISTRQRSRKLSTHGFSINFQNREIKFWTHI